MNGQQKRQEEKEKKKEKSKKEADDDWSDCEMRPTPTRKRKAPGVTALKDWSDDDDEIQPSQGPRRKLNFESSSIVKKMKKTKQDKQDQFDSQFIDPEATDDSE